MSYLRASLVVQRLRTHLPMQGSRVPSPVGELRPHRPWGNKACTPTARVKPARQKEEPHATVQCRERRLRCAGHPTNILIIKCVTEVQTIGAHL